MTVWYDWFAITYDLSLEWLYRWYRHQTADAMDIEAHHRVLDLACGTGQNFPALLPHLTNGEVIALDYSAGMLARAAARAKRGGWEVRLVQGDAAAITEEQVGGPVDRVVVALGLSVIPGWEAALDRTLSLLKPGGTYVIFDVFAEKWVPQTSVVQWFAEADIQKRRPWEALEARTDDFELTWLKGSPHIHGGTPYIARGRRRD
jgi:ubiquinone/menaquinone biosynthesis C-methylase UbiE